MKLQLFNFPYFLYMFLSFGFMIGMFFAFRKCSRKVQNWVIIFFMVANLALHMIKAAFYPYNIKDNALLYYIWPRNLSGIIIFLFPIFYFSKGKAGKDFMCILGVISGLITIIYPASKLNYDAYCFETVRFYTCHMFNFIIPFLMVGWGHHVLDWKNCWKTPLYAMGCFAVIMLVAIILSESGMNPLRNSNFFKPNYDNQVSIWGAGSGDPIGAMLDLFCPKCLKTAWGGAHVGETKYIPLIWMIPGVTVYGILGHILLSLPIQYFHKIKAFFKKVFKKKSKYEYIG